MEAFLQKKFQPSVTSRLLIIRDGCSGGFGTVQLWPFCSPCTGTSWAAAVKLSLLHGRCTLKGAITSWWVIIPHTSTFGLFGSYSSMPSVSLNLLLIHKPTFHTQLFILQGFFWHGMLSAVHQAICCQKSTLDIWLMSFFSYRNFNSSLWNAKLQELFPGQLGMEQHREQTQHFKQISKKGLRDGKWVRECVRSWMVNSYHSGVQSRSWLSHTWNKFILSHQNGRAGEKQVAEFQESHEVEVKVQAACV